jgi:hypothetical protein
MRRTAAALLAATLSFAASAQMMGDAIATSSYFPLVDGARYDYRHSGGPWSASTMTVHAGQTWAGVSGLAAMHTTYTCNIGATCAPDATDFYRMGSDGMHYYGGTGANATGTRFSMMSLVDPEWLLKSPVVPGSMMSGGGYQNAETWQAGVSGTNSMMGGQGYMSRYQALALETVSVPAGTFANSLHVRELRGSGVVRDVWYAPGVGMVRMNDGDTLAELTGYAIPGGVAQPGGGAAPIAFMPVSGMWWNPAESGSGYDIQLQRGVMVITVYSYTAAGDPLWYLATGPLVNAGNAVSVTGMLDKYRGGQCTTCPYRQPVVTGNDGAFTMVFSSPTRASLQLPGGRVTQIQPLVW